MPYTLSDLAGDLRALLGDTPPADCADALCATLNRALTDEAFIAEHLHNRAAGEKPRKILYEDPDLGFCICGHVYDGEAVGKPHDHGPSWAVYGQAVGETTMTEWHIVEAGSGDSPTLVEPSGSYLMKQGDAHFYDVGDVHSPSRTAPTRLIRIEGRDLDKITRSNIAAVSD